MLDRLERFACAPACCTEVHEGCWCHGRRSVPLVHSRSPLAALKSHPPFHSTGASASTVPKARVPDAVPSLTQSCRPLRPSVASKRTPEPSASEVMPRSRPGKASPVGFMSRTSEEVLISALVTCSSHPFAPSLAAKNNRSTPFTHAAASQLAVNESPMPGKISVRRSERSGSKQNLRLSRTSPSSNSPLPSVPPLRPSSTPKRTTKPSAHR